MTAKLIMGTEIREKILKEIAAEVKPNQGKTRGRARPGDHPGRRKPGLDILRDAEDQDRPPARLPEIQDNQPADISEKDLLALIDKYNKDDSINGILVQLPLPKHIDEKKVLNAIDPDKDVDGFHPVNVGRLMIGGSEVKFPPCTPAGIQELIVRAGVKTNGAEVVVVGRSNIVGKPIANMMLQKRPGANSTVTIVHTRTKDLACTLQAGRHPDRGGRRARIWSKPEWIKPGACVIDVGVNRVGEKISEKTGKKVAILQGRRGLRCRQGDRRFDHPGARRRRPHDHHHADEKHPESR